MVGPAYEFVYVTECADLGLLHASTVQTTVKGGIVVTKEVFHKRFMKLLKFKTVGLWKPVSNVLSQAIQTKEIPERFLTDLAY